MTILKVDPATGTIHLTDDGARQLCGMSGRQRYRLTAIAEDFDWELYNPASHPELYCRKCRTMNAWESAFLSAAGVDIDDA